MNTRRLSEISDATLSLIVAVVGMVGIAIGFSTVAHPFNISPSLDGALMAGQLGFVLAMLHGLKFRRVLWMMAPVIGVLAVAALRQHESAFALVGVTLTLYGVVGIGLSLLLSAEKLLTSPWTAGRCDASNLHPSHDHQESGAESRNHLAFSCNHLQSARSRCRSHSCLSANHSACTR